MFIRHNDVTYDFFSSYQKKYKKSLNSEEKIKVKIKGFYTLCDC